MFRSFWMRTVAAGPRVSRRSRCSRSRRHRSRGRTEPRAAAVDPGWRSNRAARGGMTDRGSSARRLRAIEGSFVCPPVPFSCAQAQAGALHSGRRNL